METFTIGGDLEVRRLGFGAMRITGDGIWGPPKDPEGAKQVLRRTLELGVNLIDTADSYGPEVSENLIAEALHPYPQGLVIATKGGLRRTGPGEWPRDARPERLKECCEGSLRRLKVDRIDLYQLHSPDPQVPLEDSLGALKELQDEGKVRHIGISNVSSRNSAGLAAWSTWSRFRTASTSRIATPRTCSRHAPRRESGSSPGSRSPPGGSPGRAAPSTRWRVGTTRPPARWRSPGCSAVQT